MGQIANKLLSLNTAKHAIREAINAKGGGPLVVSDPLSAYPAAIAGIPSGGGGGDFSGFDVVFYDFDGTVLYSYSAADFLALTAMPENPDHSQDAIPLTSQGWNWTLSDAKAYVQNHGRLNIGQMYVTADGKSRFEVFVTENGLVELNNGLTGNVDWGDGSPTQAASNAYHYYMNAGTYVITIDAPIPYPLKSAYNPIMQRVFLGSGITELVNGTFSAQNALKVLTIPYGVTSLKAGFLPSPIGSLKALTIPMGVTALEDALFSGMATDMISLPNGILTMGNNCLSGCLLTKGICIPDTVTTIGNYAFYNTNAPFCEIGTGVTQIKQYALYNSKIREIRIHANVLNIQAYAFQSCPSLVKVTIEEGLLYILQSAFSTCNALSEITIPSTVTEIGANAFYGCSTLVRVIVKAVAPPTLGSSAFNNNYTYRKILVPAGSVAAYKAATNWRSYANYIEAIPE